MRQRLGLKVGEELQMILKEDCIELRKDNKKCALCGQKHEEELLEYEGLRLCRACAKKIGEMAK